MACVTSANSPSPIFSPFSEFVEHSFRCPWFWEFWTAHRELAMTSHLGEKGGSTRSTRRISVKFWPSGPRKHETTGTQDGRRVPTRAARIGNGQRQWPGTIRQSRSRSQSGTSNIHRRGAFATRTSQADIKPAYSVPTPARSNSRGQ